MKYIIMDRHVISTGTNTLEILNKAADYVRSIITELDSKIDSKEIANTESLNKFVDNKISEKISSIRVKIGTIGIKNLHEDDFRILEFIAMQIPSIMYKRQAEFSHFMSYVKSKGDKFTDKQTMLLTSAIVSIPVLNIVLKDIHECIVQLENQKDTKR